MNLDLRHRRTKQSPFGKSKLLSLLLHAVSFCYLVWLTSQLTVAFVNHQNLIETSDKKMLVAVGDENLKTKREIVSLTSDTITKDNNRHMKLETELQSKTKTPPPPPPPSSLIGNSTNFTTSTLESSSIQSSSKDLVDEESMKLPLYMRILATLACLIIFSIGVSGNFLVPLVVIKTKYLRNSTNLFLINLSMADLLLLIVSMPTIFIELHSRPETWLLGEPMCKLSNFVEMLAANGSIFTILAISFERYYAICKPLKAGYKCTRLRATIIICIIWLFAITLTSPILIMAKSNQTTYLDGSLVYNCILETDTYWTKMYVFISMFAFFCLPLLVLMLVYWLISRRLIRENLAMSSTTTTSLATTSCEISTSDSIKSKQAPALLQERNNSRRRINATASLVSSAAISLKKTITLKKATSLKTNGYLDSTTDNNLSRNSSITQSQYHKSGDQIESGSQTNSPKRTLTMNFGNTKLARDKKAFSFEHSSNSSNNNNAKACQLHLGDVRCQMKLKSNTERSLEECNSSSFNKTMKKHDLAGLHKENQIKFDSKTNKQQLFGCNSLLAIRRKFADTFLCRLLNIKTSQETSPQAASCCLNSPPPSSCSFGTEEDEEDHEEEEEEGANDELANIHAKTSNRYESDTCSTQANCHLPIRNAQQTNSNFPATNSILGLPSVANSSISTNSNIVVDISGYQYSKKSDKIKETDKLVSNEESAAEEPFLEVNKLSLIGMEENAKQRSKCRRKKRAPRLLDLNNSSNNLANVLDYSNKLISNNYFSSIKRNSCSSSLGSSTNLPSTATTSTTITEQSISCSIPISATPQVSPKPILQKHEQSNGPDSVNKQQQNDVDSRKCAHFNMENLVEVANMTSSNLNTDLSSPTTSPITANCSTSSPSSGISAFSSKSSSPDSLILNRSTTTTASNAKDSYKNDIANFIKPTTNKFTLSKAVHIRETSDALLQEGEINVDIITTNNQHTTSLDRTHCDNKKENLLILEEETSSSSWESSRPYQEKNNQHDIASRNIDSKLNVNHSMTSSKIKSIGYHEKQDSFSENRLISHKRTDRSKSTCLEKSQNSFYQHFNFSKLHQSLQAAGKHQLNGVYARKNLRSGSQPIVCSIHAQNNNNHQQHLSELLVVQDLSKKQQMDSRRQVVVMLAFVVACFFLLFLPYRFFTVWLILSTEDQVRSLGMETYYNLTYFSRILIYLHSAINPIAYNLISTKFRRAFMSILLCRGSSTRRKFVYQHRMFPNQHQQQLQQATLTSHCNSSRKVSNDERRSLRRADRQFTR